MTRTLALTILCFTLIACSSAPETKAPEPMPDIDPDAAAAAMAVRQKVEALRAEGMELLYSKDPAVKNPEKAYDKFLEAAKLGDPISMDQLGGYHSTGAAGKEKSCALAIDWFEKSAALGYELAANNLAYTLVSCPDKKFRDGQRAEDIMQALFARNQSFLAILDTYASILADRGNFTLAVKTMDTVIDIAELIKANQERIDEFKANRARFAKKQKL